MPGIYARHKCQAYMPDIYAKHICQAYVPGIYARHVCQAYPMGYPMGKIWFEMTWNGSEMV